MVKQMNPNQKRQVLERDGICTICGNEFDLVVHHIYSRTDFPEYANDIDKCFTVCRGCHYEIHYETFKNYLNQNLYILW